MPYIPFVEICPDIAVNETRLISLLDNINEFNLAQGDYAFVELFCDECDCRRAFIQVHFNREVAATIGYSWEKLTFYRKEFKGFEEEEIKELKGPGLEFFQYQSEISEEILMMFKKILFSDQEYLDRIERHYDQFRKNLG